MYRILRVRHRVEWPQIEREFVHNKIVGVVLLFDYPAQPFLVYRAG